MYMVALDGEAKLYKLNAANLCKQQEVDCSPATESPSAGAGAAPAANGDRCSQISSSPYYFAAGGFPCALGAFGAQADEPSTDSDDTPGIAPDADPLSSLSCLSMMSFPESSLPDDDDELEASLPGLPAIGTRISLCGLSKETLNGKVGLITGHVGRSKVLVVLEGMATKEHRLPARHVSPCTASPQTSIRTVSPRAFKFNSLTSVSCASLLSSISCLSLPEVDSDVDEDGLDGLDYNLDAGDRLHTDIDQGSMEEVRTRMNQLAEQVALGVAVVASDGKDRIDGTLQSAIALKLAKMQRLKNEIREMRRKKDGLSPSAVSSTSPNPGPLVPFRPNTDKDGCDPANLQQSAIASSSLSSDSCHF
jgi:hypothetical protein